MSLEHSVMPESKELLNKHTQWLEYVRGTQDLTTEHPVGKAVTGWARKKSSTGLYPKIQNILI